MPYNQHGFEGNQAGIIDIHTWTLVQSSGSRQPAKTYSLSATPGSVALFYASNRSMQTIGSLHQFEPVACTLSGSRESISLRPAGPQQADQAIRDV